MELHLNKPPITEAVLEIRVQSEGEIDLDRLSEAFKLPDYPVMRPHYEVEVEGVFDEAEQVLKTSGKRAQIGWTLNHSNEKQVIRAFQSVFGLSRLAPYPSWKEFSGEARRLWDIYRQIVVPKTVIRVALRYVNRIDIPLPIRDLKDYLRTYPEVSPDMPQVLSGYFMRLESPQPGIKANVVLHQALVPPPSEFVVSVLLDIDLHRSEDIPQDEPGLWELFQELRLSKNDTFRACLTDSALELFN